MTTIILTIHIIIAVALVGVILLQRNEGGGLGIGGGGGQAVVYDSIGTANALTRATTVLAVAFFFDIHHPCEILLAAERRDVQSLRVSSKRAVMCLNSL